MTEEKKEKTRPGFEPGTLIQGVLHLVPKGMKLPLGMDLEVLPSQCVNRYTTLPVSYPLRSWQPTYPTRYLTWLASWANKIHLNEVPALPVRIRLVYLLRCISI